MNARRTTTRSRGTLAWVAWVLWIAWVGGCDNGPRHDRNVKGVFGETGMGPGEFSYPRAVAVAPDGSVFVVDKTARIQRFNPKGEYETSWRMPEWQAGKPVGLSVHPDGRVFVADTHYCRVMIYDRDGHLLVSLVSTEREAGSLSFRRMLPSTSPAGSMWRVRWKRSHQRLHAGLSFRAQFRWTRCGRGQPDSAGGSGLRRSGATVGGGRLQSPNLLLHDRRKLLSTFGSVGDQPDNFDTHMILPG